MRARNLKPGYFKNEVLGSADPICGHVFQGLWGLADREGRLEDRLQRIHVEINAYRDVESTRCAIQWLIEHGFVLRYQVDGQTYLLVTNFREHQHPHVKEPPSKLPGPGSPSGGNGGAPGQPRASTGPAPDEHQTGPVQVRRIPDSGFRTPESGLRTPETDGPKGPNGESQKQRPERNFDDLRRAATGLVRMPGRGAG